MSGLRRKKPLARGGPLQRTAGLASVTPLQRGGPIPPVSARRRAENRQRRVMLDDLYRGERPLCAVWELMQPEWCARWADDAHEPLSRARGGGITDPENCRAICRPCHTLVTDKEPDWAYEAGLLRHSWDATGGAA